MSLQPEHRLWAAQQLGMKPSEIVAIEVVGEGRCHVTTHDGAVTEISQDGVRLVSAGAASVPRTPAQPVPVSPIAPAPPSPGTDAADAQVAALLAGDEVPDAKAEVVLKWVHHVPEQVADRAARALAAELAGKQRAGLTADLEKLATPADPAP
ncbi:MAG: hypothetical protein ACREXJ_00125 [Gammaproteobacteria bacterium]